MTTDTTDSTDDDTESSTSTDQDESDDPSSRSIVSTHEDVLGETIDRGQGCGSRSSLEDLLEENHDYRLNDGRSKTQTTFYARDAPGNGPPQKHRPSNKRRSWSELAKINDGMWDKGRGKSNDDANKRRDAEAFADGVGLTKHERERAVRIIDNTDVRSFSVPHTPKIEHVILTVCGLIRDEHARTTAERIVTDEMFHQIRESIELPQQKHVQLRRDLLAKTSFFDHEAIDRWDFPSINSDD